MDDPRRFFKQYQRINDGLWAALERGETTQDRLRVERFELLLTETGIEADADAMADAFVAGLGANGELYPGAREVLDELAGRSSLAMITNGLGEVQRARLDRLDLEQYFDAIVISAEIGAAKPGTEIFDVAFESLGNPPKTTAVMIGDSLTSDIAGGTNAGIATCWYNPHGRTAGAEHKITHQITTLEELLTF